MANTQRARAPKTVSEARAAALAHPLVGAILAADDRPFKDIEVPEWPLPDGKPAEIRIRGASGTVVDAHDASMFALKATQSGDMNVELSKNYRSRFLVGCLFDPETDEPLPITAEQLGSKSGRVINRLFAIAQQLSGQGPRAIEEAGKDSKTDLSGSSTTG